MAAKKETKEILQSIEKNQQKGNTLLSETQHQIHQGNTLLSQTQGQIHQMSLKMDELNFRTEQAARIQNEQLKILTLTELDRQKQKAMKNKVFLMKRAFDSITEQEKPLSRFLLLEFLFQRAIEPNLDMLNQLNEIPDKDYFYNLQIEIQKSKDHVLQSLSEDDEKTAREFHHLFSTTQNLPHKIFQWKEEKDLLLATQKKISQESIAPHPLSIVLGIGGIVFLALFLFFGIPALAAFGCLIWIEIKHRKKEKDKKESRMQEIQEQINKNNNEILRAHRELDQAKQSLYAIADLSIFESLEIWFF